MTGTSDLQQILQSTVHAGKRPNATNGPECLISPGIKAMLFLEMMITALRQAEHSRAVFNWAWEGPPVSCLMLLMVFTKLKITLQLEQVCSFQWLEDGEPLGAGPRPVWYGTLYHMPGNCAGSPYCCRRPYAYRSDTTPMAQKAPKSPSRDHQLPRMPERRRCSPDATGKKTLQER